MSKEYIEREAAKRALRIWITECVIDGDTESADRFRDCIDILDSLDTADVAPVRHGRWVHDHYEKCTEQFEIVKCSNCGIKMYAIALSVKDANYCRNCGAKMGGDTP